MQSRRSIPVAGLLTAVLASAGCAGGTAEPAREVTRAATTVARTGAGQAEEIVVDRALEGDYEFRGGTHATALEIAAEELARDDGAVRVRVVGLRGVAGLRAPHRVVEERLDEWRERYLARGLYLVRYWDSFGYGDGRDAILLLPTRDQFEVVRAVGTNGLNYDIGNARIVHWLRDLHRTHPFVVTEAGLDFVGGNFARPVRDPERLAQRFFRFCPDIVLQGTDTVTALADELRTSQTLYCWWD